jgi:hypothetical protein
MQLPLPAALRPPIAEGGYFSSVSVSLSAEE